jgi:putative phosphoribosyl transferase
MPFADRTDAGHRLARRLDLLRDHEVVVLGVPRGGVPVAFEVADGLDAPLDVVVVGKVGVPFRSDVVMGAAGEGGVGIRDQAVIKAHVVSPPELAAVERAARTELERRLRRLRDHRPQVPLAGRIAVVVDDGMTTGLSAGAACRIARARGARLVFLAVPVSPPAALARVRGEADEVVCLETRENLAAVGECYADFRETTDDEVAALLATASA